MRAAVLMTCFNRKLVTLSCLESIKTQLDVEGLSLDIYLVDDGSSDGTASAVANAFPEVKILKGDGNLYWNGGMNLAWKTAANNSYTFYLWLNDDIKLSPNAFQVMFNSFYDGREEAGTNPVIVGSFCEPNMYAHAYGGFKVVKTMWGYSTKRVLPKETITSCDTFNGNLVLVPESVVRKVGLLDDQFTHSLGDKDYGYRCMRMGIPMYITSEYIGECARNSIRGTWMDPDVPLRERYKKLLLPTGLPPTEYFYAVRKNRGALVACVTVLKLYLRLLFPRLWSRLSRRKSGE